MYWVGMFSIFVGFDFWVFFIFFVGGDLLNVFCNIKVEFILFVRLLIK